MKPGNSFLSRTPQTRDGATNRSTIVLHQGRCWHVHHVVRCIAGAAFAAGLGAAAMWGLVFAFAPEPPAQAKKDDAKADKKEAEPEIKTDAKFKDIMVSNAGGVEQVAYINELIEKGWKDNKVAPSQRCTDYEFIRRASLDIIGRIATLKEIDSFMADPPERRRSLLIERLLEEPRVRRELRQHLDGDAADPLRLAEGPSGADARLARRAVQHDPSKNGWARHRHRAALGRRARPTRTPAVNFILHHLGEPIPQTSDRPRTASSTWCR